MRRVALHVGSVGFLLIAMRAALVAARSETHGGAWLFFLLALVISGLAILEIEWSRRRFLDLEPIVVNLLSGVDSRHGRRWYRMCIRRMYSRRRLVLTSALFMPIIAYGLWITRWASWIDDPVLRYFDLCVTFLALTVAASSPWPFSQIALFIARLPKKPLKVNLLHHHDHNVMALGTFLMKIDLGGVLLVSLAAAGVLLAPARVPLPIYLLIVAVLLWAVIWFFATQHQIHLVMRREKRDRLSYLAPRLSELLDQITYESHRTRREALEEYQALKEIYEQVVEMPEWPFKNRDVVRLVSGVFIPLALTLAELLLPGLF